MKKRDIRKIQKQVEHNERPGLEGQEFEIVLNKFDLMTIEIEPKYLTSYKGIWYKYSPDKHSQGLDVWELSENQYDTGFKIFFNSDMLRLDQCFEEYKKEFEKH